ncbi:hypothetical protein RYZ20_04970 [Thioclava sp. A2]|uniref:hypothetical protein n=1 Tax=Thioclava sp. FCG-A2 TaxID=3080562 RepID=UPI002952FFB2|nr:hypothetical protein [Thioclava sp. A2]MDV7270248.1 hypothetical protein [Thioclava sp. A2]
MRLLKALLVLCLIALMWGAPGIDGAHAMGMDCADCEHSDQMPMPEDSGCAACIVCAAAGVPLRVAPVFRPMGQSIVFVPVEATVPVGAVLPPDPPPPRG